LLKSLCQLDPEVTTTTITTMPYLTALIYKYEDGSKNFHKVKVRLQSPLSGTVRLSKPIVRPRASHDEFIDVGTFRWQYQGHLEPEPWQASLLRGASKSSGWCRVSGDLYYIWHQIPESIVKKEKNQRRAQDLHARLRAHEQKAMEFNNYSTNLHARLLAEEGQPRTTNLSWALTRARDMWNEIDDDHEEMTAKRMKLSGA
jgi:hypothetical protein